MISGVNGSIKWLASVVIPVALGAAVYYYFDDDEVIVNYRTVSPQRGDYTEKVQATGTLEPTELVDVGAQMSGIIMSFGKDDDGKVIDYGSDVKEGQLLAVIDDTFVNLDIRRLEAGVQQAEASIAVAEAKINQAQANYNKAKRDRDRVEKLGPGDALSQTSYDEYVSTEEAAAASLVSAQASLEEAKASRASAQAQLDYEKENIKYVQITSPVNGTIIVRQVSVGQTVVSNMSASSLFLIARDLTKMQIWASVNEADIAKVSKGQAVHYTVDALPNETFTGVVNKIRLNATMSSNVVTYIVEIDIENPDRRLLPYLSANVDFIVKEHKNVSMVSNDVFSFTPVDLPPAPPSRPDGKGDEKTVTVWKLEGKDQLVPLRVKRGDDDGTKSVISMEDGSPLPEGVRLVAGTYRVGNEKQADSNKSQNLFGPNPPKRRERSTGGADAKTPQRGSGANRQGPPPM